MVDITRNALQPLPPSTLSLNARQTSSSFPTTIPPPIPQHAAPVFRPHASTSTSILSSAAKYKWDVMEAKAAGRPLPAKPRESSNVRGGGGYRKKEPIGSHKVSSHRRECRNIEIDSSPSQRKETLEDKHMARISTLGQMQLSFEHGRKEGMSYLISTIRLLIRFWQVMMERLSNFRITSNSDSLSPTRCRQMPSRVRQLTF